MKKHVLSIGQCGFDHGNISNMLKRHFDALVTPAHSKKEALELAGKQKFDLVLVNRLLDADGSSGLEIIATFKKDQALKSVPLMLVSNHDDAQKEAVTQGALPGFGKAAVDTAPTVARIGNVLNEKS